MLLGIITPDFSNRILWISTTIYNTKNCCVYCTSIYIYLLLQKCSDCYFFFYFIFLLWFHYSKTFYITYDTICFVIHPHILDNDYSKINRGSDSLKNRKISDFLYDEHFSKKVLLNLINFKKFSRSSTPSCLFSS